jgi:hypothetical protein
MPVEHVAPYYRGADVGERFLDDRGAFVYLSAIYAMRRAKHREGESSLVQARAADAEGVLHALAGPDAKPSSDIEILKRSLDMPGFLGARGDVAGYIHRIHKMNHSNRFD